MAERKIIISRRRFLSLVGSAGVAGAGIALGIGKLVDNIDESIEKVQEFKPISGKEIGREIDEQTFKNTVHDLFAFSDEIEAGKVGYYWPLKEGARKRDISFKTKDEYGTITFVWGLIPTRLLGKNNFESTAREISWYIVPNDQTMGNNKLVAFAKDFPVQQFIPAPYVDRENGIVEPQTLNSQQMAEFLKQTLVYFNSRIS